VEDVIDTIWRVYPVEVIALPGREERIEFRLPQELATAEGASRNFPATI
jgi:hypothetical protein